MWKLHQDAFGGGRVPFGWELFLEDAHRGPPSEGETGELIHHFM